MHSTTNDRILRSVKRGFAFLSAILTIFSFLCYIQILNIDFNEAIYPSAIAASSSNGIASGNVETGYYIFTWSQAIFFVSTSIFLLSTTICYWVDIDATEFPVLNIRHPDMLYYISAKRNGLEPGKYVTIYEKSKEKNTGISRVFAVGKCEETPTKSNVVLIMHLMYGTDSDGTHGDRPSVNTLDKDFIKRLVIKPYMTWEALKIMADAGGNIVQ